MKVILLHNAKAGGRDQPAPARLVDEFRRAGHEVVYQSTREKGAKWVMLEPADLVVAAGGDGTVRKAALGVAGRGVPLAILPLGTANNLARTFGNVAPVSDIIRGLPGARRVRLDVALATGPWGKIPFVESAGVGLLARTMSFLTHASGLTKAPSVAAGREHLRKLLETYPARSCSATVDEQKISGEYLLVEAMNTRSVGPNVFLAPEADPGDGLLDYVFLKAEAREEFSRFVAGEGNSGPVPVEIVRGRNLRLLFDGPVHIDDFTWPDEERQAKEEKGKAPNGEQTVLEIHLPSEPLEVFCPIQEKRD